MRLAATDRPVGAQPFGAFLQDCPIAGADQALAGIQPEDRSVLFRQQIVSEQCVSPEGGKESTAGMTLDPLAVVIEHARFPEDRTTPFAQFR